ncbi:MAG: GNAT family N-acetyltransferase [Jaaginema sp. PMC 1079.18]|nr:GNAT family N-acetyltransferase [Jaaginema sp. PMC 1080.18]MEC4850158.1 GNAT family N-acetyltransferase [Jaaginema sp. PMC 1079.18]MEC4866065.1 GNAT family N-acetyltransferase [Jaaginema sp. PMC 1078.18]
MSGLKIYPVKYADDPNIQNIRYTVFQVEQGVDAALEFDGKDAECEHLIAYQNNTAVGTTRLRKLNPTTLKIERLAVIPSARKQGVGTALMEAAIQWGRDRGYTRITLNAQSYIQSLYRKLGFEPVGEEFLEAGIVHIKMSQILPKP